MSLPLFNSLGSNYSHQYVELATQMFWWGDKKEAQTYLQLLQRLEQRFQAEGLLLYKGRDAIELAVRAIVLSQAQLPGRRYGVLTQGFACHAVEEGMLRSAVQPVYVDLAAGTLGPSVKTLEEGLRRAKAEGLTVLAVFLQHTLGYINPRAEIFAWAKKYQLLIIEDLAQSFGAQDERDQELGQGADIVICSFGRDKVIDAVAGGAVFIRRHHQQFVKHLSLLQPSVFPPFLAKKKEMIYPKLTEFIRTTHAQGVGKVVFKIAKILGLFTSPLKAATTFSTKLPAEYAALALYQLDHLENQLRHRRQVAAVYIQEFQHQPEVTVLADLKKVDRDLHLRLPILFQDPADLYKVLKHCQRQQIYLTDRWYRSVVDSGSLDRPSVYVTGTCPVAETTAQRLLNLPTHEKISLTDARRISTVIKQALSSS